ncbi:uncharacterized protein LOC106773080 [Vigna radiata var. radiata]|uniref:Uncharacterized protein LOC106773080 n=1 Tax=Vigna radiata var. radiata TaxID=3916 RepID=A0A3Q0FD51_VIGRR|nr:uncharacterized protein LOC106773080 [Vigna radiata var. radiata]
MSSSTKKHDVFVSFRGDDTRTNFTSHLCKALEYKSIGAYIDCQLDRGESVWPALAKAIQDSHVSIVVFSENYACSKWCLEELVKILECRKELGLVVIPVFYNIDPSDIRNQKGTYEKALLESDEEKGPKWKAALTEAANISGWDSRKHRDEAHVIENVVNDVLQKLHLRCPTALKGLVASEENCRNVDLLLKSCRVIGIWGMGGIGEVDGSMCIKECGVGLISVSELPSVLEELDWHSDKKKDFVDIVELITGQRITLTSIEQSDERKNHFSAVEEIINSTHKEVKTDSDTDCGQNTAISTNAVKYEGNRKTVESELDKEHESKEKSIEDNRGSKEYFSDVEESIEYCASSATNATAKRGPKEKSTKSTGTVANEHAQRLEESIKQVVEIHDTDNSGIKYSSLDLENCLQQLDENPFAILDLLSYELSPSLKQSNDATTLLNEFRTLVFSTSLLKKIPDQSYQQQVAESLQKLHTCRGKITKEQEAGLDTFRELYNKAVDISQDKMLTEVNQAKLASEKRDLYNKLEHSKLKIQQFDTTISTCKSQRENLQKRQREIQKAIKTLQQENEALEKDSSTLEVLYSEQQTKKKETLESVKCISISVVQTTKQLEELEKKRLSLASAYEDLKEPYQRMKTKPPF